MSSVCFVRFQIWCTCRISLAPPREKRPVSASPCGPFPALLINRWLNRLRRHRRRRMAPPTMAPSAAAPALPTAGTQQTSSCFPPRTHACLPTHACRHQYAHSPAHGAPGASCSSRWAAPASRACCSPALSCSPPAGAHVGEKQRRALPAALRQPSPPSMLQVAPGSAAARHPGWPPQADPSVSWLLYAQ